MLEIKEDIVMKLQVVDLHVSQMMEEVMFTQVHY